MSSRSGHPGGDRAHRGPPTDDRRCDARRRAAHRGRTHGRRGPLLGRPDAGRRRAGRPDRTRDRSGAHRSRRRGTRRPGHPGGCHGPGCHAPGRRFPAALGAPVDRAPRVGGPVRGLRPLLTCAPVTQPSPSSVVAIEVLSHRPCVRDLSFDPVLRRGAAPGCRRGPISQSIGAPGSYHAAEAPPRRAVPHSRHRAQPSRPSIVAGRCPSPGPPSTPAHSHLSRPARLPLRFLASQSADTCERDRTLRKFTSEDCLKASISSVTHEPGRGRRRQG